MKSYIVIILIFGCNIIVNGQLFISSEIDSLPCSFDSTVIIQKYENWDVYQTMDDNPEGEQIEVCLSLKDGLFDISNFDPSKPLFISTSENFDPVPLKSNAIYPFIKPFSFVGNVINDFCESCHSLLVYTTLPDESGDQRVNNVQEFNLPTESFHWFGLETCVPTPNLLDVVLEKFVYKISLTPSSSGMGGLYIEDFYGEGQNDVNFMLNDLTIDQSEFNNNSIQISPRQLIPNNFFPNVIVVHTNGYPSSTNKDFKEIKIHPNPSTPYEIVLTSNPFGNVYFQQYTGIIGSMVEGEDSIRHKVILEFEDPESCFGIIGDLVFGSGTQFRFISGDIHLKEKNSCLMFQDQSEMKVVEKANLHYGRGGEGMLALFDAKLSIKQGAKMLMDGQIVLKAGLDSPHIYLEDGAELSFTSDSDIWVLHNNDQYIYVYGKREQLDLSQLNLKDHKYFVFVDDLIHNKAQSLQVYPNPTYDWIGFDKNVIGQQIILYDFQGRMVHTEVMTENRFQFPDQISKGIYFIKVNGYTAKVMKQ